MGEFENMEKSALKLKLQQLREELEEIEEERAIVLGQTGLHLPGSTVTKYEAETSYLKEQIEMLEDLLNSKG
ncbi:MAG: hypothetical protein ACOX4N_09750 [Dethiobacteraceae bacterium]